MSPRLDSKEKQGWAAQAPQTIITVRVAMGHSTEWRAWNAPWMDWQEELSTNGPPGTRKSKSCVFRSKFLHTAIPWSVSPLIKPIDQALDRCSQTSWERPPTIDTTARLSVGDHPTCAGLAAVSALHFSPQGTEAVVWEPLLNVHVVKDFKFWKELYRMFVTATEFPLVMASMPPYALTAAILKRVGPFITSTL